MLMYTIIMSFGQHCSLLCRDFFILLPLSFAFLIRITQKYFTNNKYAQYSALRKMKTKKNEQQKWMIKRPCVKKFSKLRWRDFSFQSQNRIYVTMQWKYSHGKHSVQWNALAILIHSFIYSLSPLFTLIVGSLNPSFHNSIQRRRKRKNNFSRTQYHFLCVLWRDTLINIIYDIKQCLRFSLCTHSINKNHTFHLRRYASVAARARNCS